MRLVIRSMELASLLVAGRITVHWQVSLLHRRCGLLTVGLVVLLIQQKRDLHGCKSEVREVYFLLQL